MSKNASMLSNTWYDRLKFLAQIGLPAIGSFYLVLSGVWGFPNGEQVVGSITATCLLLGTLLGLSSSKYSGSVNEGSPVGEFVVQDDPESGKKLVTLKFDQDPESLIDGEAITFKVNRGENVS